MSGNILSRHRGWGVVPAPLVLRTTPPKCPWCEVPWRGCALCPVSMCVWQGSVGRAPAVGPNEFNSVAGYFFFPLLQHFDR